MNGVLMASLALLLCLQVDPLQPVGSLTDGLRSPARVAIAPDGTVLVSDPFRNHIARYDASGTLVGTWAVPEGPIGVAAHPDGRYFVSLRDGGKVAVYDSGFNRTGFLGDGNPLVGFILPTDIDIADDSGRIFVTDGEGDRIYSFESDGTLALIVGIRGHLPSEFKYPSAVSIDEARGRIVVADHDNFRVQVFSTSGVFEDQFGYRIKYLPGGAQEGWMPRSQGLAVDAAGRIYVADALMGTVRLFDNTGAELGKVVEYGVDPGDVRTPCDLGLNSNGSRLYVVSTNTSSVEIYETSSLIRGQPSRRPDVRGRNWCSYDALRRWAAGRFDVMGPGPAGVSRRGRAGGVWPIPRPDELRSLLLRDIPGWDGPHMIDEPVICGRCHGITGQPGGHPGLLEGQVVLCLSCHSAGGQALRIPVHERDQADPYGTNPNAADGRGISHAWGLPAVNASADSIGPAPGSDMEAYLEDGKIKCSTCHNQHNSDAGSPYLRVSNDGDAMCKECHAPRNEGLGERGTHPVGLAYPGGTGEFPDASSVGVPPLKEGKVECTTCHAPHYGSSGGANDGEGDGMLLRGPNDETFCRGCHAEHVIHDVRGGWQPTCADCHGVHDPDSENLSLVAAEVNATAMTFQDNELGSNGMHDFIHSNHDPVSYDGMCEVCHTDTAHHRNSPAGDHDHYRDQLCTDCHPHDAGFLPMGGSCVECHSQAQGGRRPVVPDGTHPHDFGNTSHHVRGEVQNSDCVVCHDVSEHRQGHVRVRDPDDANIIYVYDQMTPEQRETFCVNCHDGDGAAAGGGTQPFSDGETVPNIEGLPGSLWADSAHQQAGQGCTDCHVANAHGSDNIKLLQAPQVDSLCYQCHTDGMIVNNALSGPGVADDIQQAFSLGETHDLGTNFTVGSTTYTLQCTTCHNPHVVTGKHWDVPNGVSPVTRPDLAADPAVNPRAMGIALWGTVPGQKMDDFAGLASGTGGWYYSVARGGVLVWDQPGVYQPPKTEGGGWDNHEFDGNVLPDYASLCLDCHTHRMSAANPPVNYGQGIPCTGNSVDPPDQRVECGAQHGLAPANKPYAWDPGSTFYGNSGNPDPIFNEPLVQRGRGAGQFMRWPYDSAHRNAGINFVMSCTDCHEAHGSPVGSMLRTVVNNGPGSTIWNTMCNNCHYYYGYQHAGMSCGNASCHEANSIHRIIHNTESGGTFLWTEPSRPTATPEIATVEGAVGSGELMVTFTQGVWTNSDQTGALLPGDFLLTDAGGDNPRTVIGLTHTPGDATAVVAMSAPLILDDFGNDTLATRGISVWDLEGDPAGPWPVGITGLPAIETVEGAAGFSEFLLTFDEGVYANSDGTGGLEPADFVLTDVDGNNPRIITDAAHTAGGYSAIITMSAPLDAADIGADTIGAAAASVFDASGNPMPQTPVVIAGTACPVWGTAFELNEPAGSPTATDSSGRLIGQVGNPGVAFPGDGYFHGDEDQNTYIDFNSNGECLISPATTGYQREVTLEARVRPDVVDLDTGDPERNSTLQRIIERKRTFQFTIMRGDWWGDNVPERAGKARVMFKYRAAPPYRRDCGAEGPGAWMKQVASDIDLYPIVAGHWYKIRIVFSSNKPRIPVDIWADDHGTDGSDTGEHWSGYRNIAMPDPQDSGSCKWMSQPGDEMASDNQFTHIGSPPNHNSVVLFKGLIDWVTWRPIADYAGVDDPPNQ